ncbi:MAG: ATP-binding protein [Bacteroidota bacterium]
MPRKDSKYINDIDGAHFEFEGLEIAKWVCLCIMVSGSLIGSMFLIQGNPYRVHYYIYGVVVFFILPYYLIQKGQLKIGRVLISYALPILICAISIVDKHAQLTSGDLDPVNFLDVRFILVCSLIFPIMISPLKPAFSFWINVFPSVLIIALFDPIHNFFQAGYERTGLSTSMYFFDLNLYAFITTVVLTLSLIYLKRKTAASISYLRSLSHNIEENAEQLNFMVENATQGTWKWNIDDRTFEFSDKTKRFLQSGNTVCPDDKIIDFIHPEDHQLHLKAFQDTLSNKKIYNVEIRIKDPQKDEAEYQWVQSLGEVIRDQSGKIVKMLGLFIDIKDRKNIQLELERRNKELERINATLLAAEKEKSTYLEKIELQLRQIESKNRDLDQFAYVVSHDLKAPLRAINNLATWIQEDIGESSKEVQSNFYVLKSRVERLDNFIDGLLEYSRVGRMNLDLEQVDLDIMINDIVRSFDNESVTIQKSGTFPVIKGYKVLIHQLFQNLISNAIKHNDKSQRLVHLKYDLHGDSHIFYVKDNGPGIRPELREKVFKIFQTLKPKDEQESTGIGLSIVKKIIEEIKGEIEVCDSDEGALIKFSIPTSVDKPFPIL